MIKAFDDAKSATAVLAKLNGPLEDVVTLEIRRPRAIKMSLSKPGALGMKLDYQDHSAGAVRHGQEALSRLSYSHNS